MFLECSSTVVFERRLGQVASFCTDMGTELGVADYVGDWHSLMPSWTGLSVEPDVGLPGADHTERHVDHLFRQCMTISGLLHT
eukprot:4105099-Alexandrium_andersonii.AAC.1